ncbi:MAG: hypothetical protein LKG56_07900 [Lachnospiraceae bacterium]|jgi:hypothetical protein|nr:hypothetical protein [Lachnospiraceae bacterium]MCH4031826.1 hypothetical protein [Lachnospiraceae bacterium]MCH4070450.1 hypothetical protein [Lachnospiraceae bacterium]MCH4109117.1 hypothetical protein [Lachnospiraceae bacterium]MCI1302952.1 hypothetical protein [Lachnospiraceae bacterium]
MDSKKEYVKPAIKVVSLRNEETVANTCWGYHGSNHKLFCDIPGAGYMSFQIGGSKCSLNLTNVMYYSDTNHDGKIDGTDAPEQITSGSDSRYQELDKILRNSGGESGNPYKGEGTTVIPDQPGKWS